MTQNEWWYLIDILRGEALMQQEDAIEEFPTSNTGGYGLELI